MPDMLNKAIAFHKDGRLDEALEIYAQILQDSPAHPDALHLAGLIHFAQKDIDKAIPLLRNACSASEKNAIFHADLSKALLADAQNEAATKHLETAVTLKPDYGEAHFLLGTAYRNLGSFREAAEAYENAAQLGPQTFAAHFNAGLGYFSCRTYKKAQQFFEHAIKLQPQNAEAHRLLGACLLENRALTMAEQEIREALKLNEESAEAWYYLGNVHREKGAVDAAIGSYNRAMRFRPDYIEAITNLGETYQAAGQIDKALLIYADITSRHPECAIAVSNMLLCMNYSPRFDNEKLYNAHVRYAAKSYPHDTGSDIKRQCTLPSQTPLRIGYVSADFKRHSVAYFLEPLLSHHDKNGFDIYCYASVSREDEVTARLKRMAKWRDIFSMDDQHAADAIRNDKIDILVDLAGHTAGNRLGIFAQKPAPVQISYIGYPNTTGLEQIDYRITDKHADPEGMDRFYTEKLVRLNDVFLCYMPPENAPECDVSSAAKRTRVIYGSFNNIGKISDSAIEAWSAILAAVPDSELVLKYRLLDNEYVSNALFAKFKKNGINPSRIHCFGYAASLQDHLSAYNNIDVALDTFPYNGTTTTCEALWMGVPVITLAGQRHAGRVGVSLLSSVGCTELIAANIQQYVGLAKKLASDRNAIADYRNSLRTSVESSSLCNARNYVLQLENAYRSMPEA